MCHYISWREKRPSLLRRLCRQNAAAALYCSLPRFSLRLVAKAPSLIIFARYMSFACVLRIILRGQAAAASRCVLPHAPSPRAYRRAVNRHITEVYFIFLYVRTFGAFRRYSRHSCRAHSMPYTLFHFAKIAHRLDAAARRAHIITYTIFRRA